MAAAPSKEPIIKLVCSDGQTLIVSREIARMSATIRTMLDDLPIEVDFGGSEEDRIPLANVNGETLASVIAWCTHHKGEPEPKEDEQIDNISQWDLDFLNDIEQSKLFELMVAAHYLDIKGLLYVICVAVANKIKGKEPEEIRQMFNIKNDFTPAKDEEIVNSMWK